MKRPNYFVLGGVTLLVAGTGFLLALAGWWLRTDQWVELSLVDTIALASPGTAAEATLLLSDFTPLYLIFGETPLYGLLLVVGATVASFGLWRTRRGPQSD